MTVWEKPCEKSANRLNELKYQQEQTSDEQLHKDNSSATC